jgi:ABC-2 type transport system ATP-binding protein
MTAAIELRGVTKEFAGPGHRIFALDGVDLTVAPGMVYGFLGPNGAGKTTTIHVLLGFLTPTEGTARLFGELCELCPARHRIGYLPENPQSYPYLTGRELLLATGRLFGLRGRELKQRTSRMLERAGLSHAGLQRIGTYSRGMLQRIGLAQALMNHPDLVILDEPTSGLDPVGRNEVRRWIEDLKKEGTTVFFSSHELSEVELICDHVAILKQGRVMVEGRIHDLIKGHTSLERYFLSVIEETS